MTPERWQAVKELFLELEALPPGEREAYLRARAGVEAEVSSAVQELLDQSSGGGFNLLEPCWPSEPAALAGTVFDDGRILLGRFEIVEKIGAGGLGEVYRAVDLQQGTAVALKTMRAGTEAGNAVPMLRKELNTARSVTHPNVCRLYDFHVPPDGDTPPFFTMELLDGETLTQMLRRRAPLTETEALPLLEQLIAGLGAIHDAGVVHRDLKTSNVMITEGGKRVVVMDFGLAREVKPLEETLSSLGAGQLLGTPAYMAPEQLRGEPATYASDIHAVGVIMFEMVTGHRPFEGGSPLEIASRRLHDSAPSARIHVPQLNRGWEYAIARCLQREPSARPQHVQDIREIMRRPPPFFWLKRRNLLAGAVVGTVAGAGILAYRSNAELDVEVFDIENQTGDAALTYLCRGTTSEVMRRLSQLPGVTVIPVRTTRVKAAVSRPTRLSMDGMMQAADGTVRLNIHLTDNRTGRLLWSESYDNNRFRNLLSLQSEIAHGAAVRLEQFVSEEQGTVVAGVSKMLSPGVAPQASPTRSSAAFDLYLRGNSLLQEATPDSLRTAREFFARAVNEDSRFALAHASLAEASIALRNFGYTADGDLTRAARESAERAVREEPTLPEAHAALAAVRQLEWDWAGAEESYNEALRLKPDFPRALRWRGGLLLQFARFDEAIADMQEAARIDPYDRPAITTHSLALLFAGRAREAVELLEAGIGERDMPAARYNLCQAYARLGYLAGGPAGEPFYQQAFRQAKIVETIERKTPASPSELSTRMYALIYSLRGELAQAQPFVRNLEDIVSTRGASPGFLAMIYATQRRAGDALDTLDRALQLRDRIVLYLRVNIFLENLWGLPRYEAMLRNLKLK